MVRKEEEHSPPEQRSILLSGSLTTPDNIPQITTYHHCSLTIVH